MRVPPLILAGVATAVLALVLGACGGGETTADATKFRECAERDLGTFPRPINHFPTSEDAVSFGLSSRKLDGGSASLNAGGPDAFVYDSASAADDGTKEAEAAGLFVGGEENVIWVSSEEPLAGEFASALHNCVLEAS
ncbi:MAG: hypothetical protein ACOYD4_03350 [Solirubrobacterales bacterium]